MYQKNCKQILQKQTLSSLSIVVLIIKHWGSPNKLSFLTIEYFLTIVKKC